MNWQRAKVKIMHFTEYRITENATLQSEEDGELSPFQSAARAGKYSGKDCDNLYDCILDPLGSIRYLVHWYSKKHENARLLLSLVDYK